MKRHTYLDGTIPFMYLGLWVVGSSHSTATLSIQGESAICTWLCCVHRLNIFLSCFGPRAGQALIFVGYLF
ncbi:hypothetical protein OF83DRAFT_1050535 [Amylostereum chailletii]|nr:hypothetical protein OF83DRAFT_1050535 [Amylostereum chailletii]